MKEYKISIIVFVPDEVSDKQVKKWAEFITGYTGSLKKNNPIYEQRGSNIEAISCHLSKP